MNHWRKKVGTEEADAVLARASVFGTRLHSIAQKIALGTYDDSDTEMEPYAAAVREFLENEVAEVLAVELEIISPRLRYGGTLDLYCRLRDGSLAIVDYKTSAQLSREHGLQLAGYAMLAREHDMKVNRRIAVRVKKDKPGAYFCRTYKDHAADVKAYLSLLEFWWWRHGESVRKRIARSA